MQVVLDLRVSELLGSRICHDLISPVGAINNGIELLEEMGTQVGEEAVKLIGHSAEQASRRLRLFRLSYGAAGADSNLTCDDVLATARDYLAGARATLTWKVEEMKNIPGLPKGTPKVLLNMVMIAADLLPTGGEIEVTSDVNAKKINVLCVGRGIGQREEFWAPLEGKVEIETLTAKTVHAYVTGKFAEQYGATLTRELISEERLCMSLTYSQA